MRSKLLWAAAVFSAMAVPAHARLTEIRFTGSGVTTGSCEFEGRVCKNAPPGPGAPFNVRGTLFFSDGSAIGGGGDDVVADDYTGIVNFQGFSRGDGSGYNRYIWGADYAFGRTGQVFAGGWVKLRAGKLVAVSLGGGDDPEESYLAPTTAYYFDRGYRWQGAWRLDVGAISPIPEPSTWATMVLGFGLAGAALRRRAAGKARRVA